MADQDADKTQDATPHRREQAREEGQLARSQDLASATVLVGGLLVLYAFIGPLVRLLVDLTIEHLGGPAWLQVDTAFATSTSYRLGGKVGVVLLPILALLAAIGAAVSIAQVGFLFLPQLLMPKLERIDPLRAFGRIFSLSGAVRLGFGVLKIAIVAGVSYWSLADEQALVLGLVERSLGEIGGVMLELLFWTALKIGLTLLLLALLDYGYQWWQHEQDLRMTNEEVREELKSLQGDPQVLARRRAVQRQLVLNRLSSSVPKADVVVTNPTELAVAIRYDPLEMKAPVVVAKGAGVLAQRIRRLALEHGVPIVEKKPLAQALYREVEIDHPVPAQYYGPVAEVLAYVYQLQGRKLPDR